MCEGEVDVAGYKVAYRSRDPRPLLRYTAKNLRVPRLHPRCVSREEVDVIHADRHRERGISTQFPYL